MGRSDPMPAARLRRWPWIAALTLVCVLFAGASEWLAARADRARDAAVDARGAAAELATLGEFNTAFQSWPAATAGSTELVAFAQVTVRNVRARVAALRERTDAGPTSSVATLERRLRTAERTLATIEEASPAQAGELAEQAPVVQRLVADVVADQDRRAHTIERQVELSKGGLLAAVVLLVFGLLTRARRLLLAETARHSEHLRHLADHDRLTGLPNRRRFDADLDAVDGPAALILCDLDGFKAYNDRAGHAAGDDVLVDAGRALAAELGERGAVYRLGGDELCGISTDLDPRLARRLADAVAARTGARGVTASVGVATTPQDAPDPRAALRLADERMYAAKAAGRARRAA